MQVQPGGLPQTLVHTYIKDTVSVTVNYRGELANRIIPVHSADSIILVYKHCLSYFYFHYGAACRIEL